MRIVVIMSRSDQEQDRRTHDERRIDVGQE